MKVHASKHHEEQDPKGGMSTCRNFDECLKIIDAFKTNLLWLSTFIRSVEGVSMRTPVNCRRVLQSNCFKHQEEGKEIKTILDAVCEPDGDTFQNSPLKLVFHVAFHKGPAKTTGDDELKLTSISKINVSQEKAKLPKQKDGMDLDHSNVILEMEDANCMWPRHEDLRDLLFFLGCHPHENLDASHDSFPWNDILSLFNGKDMTDADALKHMLAELSLEFLCEDHEDRETNLRRFKEFCQFMTPASASPVEGAHRIELSTRLSCAIALKEEAPFNLKPAEAK
jgi:hypothetical protein